MTKFDHSSIDVVIPVYNGENFIEYAIKSVLAQSYLPNKIIIIDDGSTDNTLKKIKKFDSKLIECMSVENGGVSSARNKGILKSDSDYIAFLDADDIFYPKKLEKQVLALEQNQDAKVAYCLENAIDENGKNISQERNIKQAESIREGKIFSDLLYDSYRVGNPSSLVVARDALLKVNGFDEKLTFSEDTDLIYRLASKYNFVCVPEILYSLRFSASSSTAKNNSVENRVESFANHLMALEKWHNLLSFNDTVITNQINHLDNLLSEVINTKDTINKIRDTSPRVLSLMGFNTEPLPSVDVIIPTYNSSKFISQTIQSVMTQTHLPNKIIIVDDGSSDSTLEIISSYPYDLIELIKLEHGGVSRARNTGIRASTSDYIAFLDSDDLWERNKLEAQLRQLMRNPRASVCYAGAQLIDDMGVDIKNAVGVPYIKGNILKDIVYHERPIYGSASSVIVERKKLLQTELFDETMQYSEDVDLWAHLSISSEFDYVSQPYVKIRVHASSTSRNRDWDKDLKILLHHFHYLNKFSERYLFPYKTTYTHKIRIIALFFKYPTKSFYIMKFFKLFKKQAPSLCRQMNHHNFFSFFMNILWIIIYESYINIKTQAKIYSRLKLFFTEGTIFFSKSKNYNSDVEFIYKKR